MDKPYNTNQANQIRPLVDAETIAKPLGLTGRTIRNWAKSKRIPIALKVGKVIRFDPEAVARALNLNLSNEDQNR